MAQERETILREEKPDCREITAMIPAFLSDSLNERDLQRFLQHVRSCQQCYKELETNYMVERTVMYLNEDLPANASFDLTPLLEKELEEKTVGLKQDRRIRVFRSVIFLFTLVLIILFLLDLSGVFRITVFFGAY